MSDQAFNIDDPRLTAYALGELDGREFAADRAEIEALLARSVEAQRLVEEVRAAGVELRAELSAEVSPGLGETRRAAVLAGQSAVAAGMRPLRLSRDDDAVDDAEGRDDVYHVITHPMPEPRRYQKNLAAVAAAVAIVTTTLTLLVSSIFHNYVHWGPAASNSPATQPATPAGQPTQPAVAKNDAANAAADDLPATNKSPRDLLAVLPAGDAASRQPFGVARAISIAPAHRPTSNPTGTAASGGYALTFENPFFEANHNPVSSFAFNVGNASYAAVQRAVEAKRLPDRSAVRIEEMVNAFGYAYAAPAGDDAFAADIEVAACPWETSHRLVRIGLKARGPQRVDQSDKSELISSDLKIRVEFNPALVSAYRLIGYDRRYLTQDAAADAERNNQVHPGQAVTALYEVVPIGQAPGPDDEPLKYQKPVELTTAATQTNELLTVKLRYTDLQNDPVRFNGYRMQEFAVVDKGEALPQASQDFKFAAAVAGFGMILRDSPHRGGASYDTVLALADESKQAAADRAKFLALVQQARQIRG
jgi:hypothetical protein